MICARVRVCIVWLGCIAVAALIVAHARYITDLSAFLPANPTPTQQLLVDQLREGPASRLILIAIEQGTPPHARRASLAWWSACARIRSSAASTTARRIAGRARSGVSVPAPLSAERVGQCAALYREPASKPRSRKPSRTWPRPGGLLFKSLAAARPDRRIAATSSINWRARRTPQSRDGVWVSADGERALAVAQTAASGSDSDAQSMASTQSARRSLRRLAKSAAPRQQRAIAV